MQRPAGTNAATHPTAQERLDAELYKQLKEIAWAFMAQERAGHTLQPTALVNQAWLRLQQSRNLAEADRSEFVAAAARAMQRVLVDHARTRNAEKRGQGRARVTLTDIEGTEPESEVDAEALDAALSDLACEYPRQHQVVILKYFSGLPVKQIAEILGLSERMVAVDWSFARARLFVALKREAENYKSGPGS